MGYGEMASALVLGSIESGHEVVGVLRWEKIHSNPFLIKIKDVFNPSKFFSFIKSLNLYDIKATSVNGEDFKKEILKLNPDIILIGAWGQKINKETFILPKIACINCHPSLLPKHRGANPYYSVIKEGETKTGITFHLVDESLDTGSILLQKEVEIYPQDTGGTLKTRCCVLARNTIKELLDGIELAKFLPVKQDESKASYYHRISAKDVIIDFRKTPEEIYNKIRGMLPWNHCYLKAGSEFLEVGNAKIFDISQNKITIQNKVFDISNFKYLKEHQLILKGKNYLLFSTIDKQKAILFEDLKLFGQFKSIFTTFYLNLFI
ncbi:MAG: methionyl-tRNA formyltransferase [Candidatus Gastranaerophilaceae bacterium]